MSPVQIIVLAVCGGLSVAYLAALVRAVVHEDQSFTVVAAIIMGTCIVATLWALGVLA